MQRGKNGPQVVQFGAGAIGRGFAGHVWREAGCQTAFVDVNAALVNALNRYGAYQIRLVDNESSRERTVKPVHGVLASDADAITARLSTCDLACTAVGANVFLSLAPVLAQGIARRFDDYDAAFEGEWTALNIVCCENQAGAARLLREAMRAALPDKDGLLAYFEQNIAFVDAVVGRMVPPPPVSDFATDEDLSLVAEPYAELPIDATAWIGPHAPELFGLSPKRNFAAHVARKLFTHNGGHALLAYQGRLRGHEYIWQAAEDAVLVQALRGFWDETGAALVRAYGFDPDEQRAHENDLLRRFRNRALGDTVARVGRDPARKLRADDRLVGAALLCLEHDIEPRYVARAIAAALRFDEPGDPSPARVLEAVRRGGAAGALGELAGLPMSSALARLVASAYDDHENDAL